MKQLREVFGEALVQLGDKNSNVVVLDADLAGATRSILFGEKYPERFYNVGITEANMVSIAAGLSTCGKIPFVSTFSFLITLRTTDQIRSQISYPGLNVKLMGANAGLTGFADGVSHQSIMDLAILRAMPNMTIIVPSDEIEMRMAVQLAAMHQGPLFLRIPRVPAPILHDQDMDFEIGKTIKLQDGTDVTIISMGMMVSRALDASEILTKDGISAEVIEVHTLKPLENEMIIKSTQKTGAVVTVEEHNKYGGLFSAVAEVIGLHNPIPIEYVAIEDRYGGSGQYEELLEDCGLTTNNIVKKVENVLKRKGIKK